MNIELVENHHSLILQVIEGPHLGLAIRGNFRAEGGIAGLGELNPHLAHGLGEGFVKYPPRVEGHLRMVENPRQLDGMSAFYKGHRGFGGEVVGVGFAAALGLALRQFEYGVNKPDMAEETAVLFVAFVRLHFSQETVYQIFIFFRHACQPLRLTFGAPLPESFQTKAGHKKVEFILVAALKDGDILCCAPGISLIGIQWQIVSVPFRELTHGKHGGCVHNLLGIDLLQLGDRLAAKYIHEYIGAGNAFLCRFRLVWGAALGNDPLEIRMGAIDERKHGAASGAGGFAPDGHIVRVAAEAGNVLMDPLQSHQLIQQPQVLGIRVVLAVGQMGQMQETEGAEPVCDSNNDDIRILFDEIVAIEHGIHRTAGFKSAAVNPYHDRLFLCRPIIRFPHIQIQAVFILIEQGAGFQLLISVGAFCIVISLVHAVIGPDFHGCFPAKFPNRRLSGKGNAPVGNDIFCFLADESTVDAFDGQRMVIVAISNLFILAVLCSKLFPLFIQGFHLLFRCFCPFRFLNIPGLFLRCCSKNTVLPLLRQNHRRHSHQHGKRQ